MASDWVQSLISVSNILRKNLILAACLLILERLLEAEFLCPCSWFWNRLFAGIFFGIPFFALILLFKESELHCSFSCFLKLIFPGMAWINVLLFDGKYLSCGFTTWNGVYVPMDTNTVQKWCKPPDTNITSNTEKLEFTQNIFMYSQLAAFVLFIIIILAGTCIYNNRHDSTQCNETETVTVKIKDPVKVEHLQPASTSTTQP